MTLGLTNRQSQLLDVLKAADKTPSYAEMGAAIGISKSNISALLDALEERGYVERLPYRARAVKVLAEPKPWINELEEFSTAALVAEIKRRVPDVRSVI